MKKEKQKKSLLGKKFLIYAEKVYEGELDESGNLICKPESEELKEIVCLDDGKIYPESIFKKIQW
ncbi:MAG: hypothetical protein HZA00_04180 [Nitrospinae bacterium]|nr:hypothetical protein [Nitrospinota bacterium]